VLTVARLMAGMSAIYPHRVLERLSEQEAVLDHARLLSADVGLISLPEAYGGSYDD
jgi:hypothetical protein